MTSSEWLTSKSERCRRAVCPAPRHRICHPFATPLRPLSATFSEGANVLITAVSNQEFQKSRGQMTSKQTPDREKTMWLRWKQYEEGPVNARLAWELSRSGCNAARIYSCVIKSDHVRYGVVANIIASHAIARGSIPRVGIFLITTSSTPLRFRVSVSVFRDVHDLTCNYQVSVPTRNARPPYNSSQASL